ncbi:hypothetical protein [Massilia sp. DWR3-1-1]|uniref:hypothetical protein n=1 Tax=Massilia sp. DWR3-1-1 TaxID=2804559 RepID=UPI003CF66B60
MSLPSCSGWLQRQANDACYDFWPDLAIGAQLPPPADGGAALPHAASATVLVLQKDAGGAWLIDPWRADQAGVMRPLAANGWQPHASASVVVALGEQGTAASRAGPASDRHRSAGDRVAKAVPAPLQAVAGAGEAQRPASASTNSFIIEIGGSAR